MGENKDGFKRLGMYSTIDPDSVKMQTEPGGIFFDIRHSEPIQPNMVANIVAIGVKEPIFVSESEGENWIYDGRQRYKNWCEAVKIWKRLGEEIKPLPCIIGIVKPAQGALLGLSLNTFHLAENPLTRIQKALELIDVHGWDSDQVATANDVSPQQIKNWRKVESLSPKVKAAIHAGKIAVSAAIKLADLPLDEQIRKLTEIIESGVKPTVANVAHNTKKIKTNTGDLSASEEERSKEPRNLKAIKKMFQRLQAECKEGSEWPEETKEQRLAFLATTLAWIDGQRTDDKLIEKWNLVGA